jgi:phage tail-like protein
MTTYRLLMGGRPIAVFESAVAEYRNGNDGVGHPMKIPGSYKVGDVTLKRGVVLDQSLANWIKSAKTKHQLTLQAIDGAGRVLQSYSLVNSIITRYKGPMLGTTNDAAFEELEFEHESLNIVLKR